MRTFCCFITDDRYSVPTLFFLNANDEERAETMALTRLFESPHHRRVEVREGGRDLFVRDRSTDDGVRRQPTA